MPNSSNASMATFCVAGGYRDIPQSGDNQLATRSVYLTAPASLAVSVGTTVKALQTMLGHASAAITLDVYADVFDEDLDDVAVALNATAVGVVGR
jgi:hypothetical protein